MKYDEKDGVIRISVKELVRAAKRGIASPSFDFEEAELFCAKSNVPEGYLERELCEKFETGGAKFELHGTAHTSGKDIFLAREFSGISKSPKKEDIAEARGEGFLLAYMLGKESNAPSSVLTIVYINKKTGERVTAAETVECRNAEKFFKKCTSSLSEYALPEIERVTVRLPSMKNARFPYGKVREGQDEFITSVYKNLARGGTLFAMAPTGTGKTVSVLYPAIRALGAKKCDKVFYFTPKTTTAQAAKECIEEMCRHGVQIRAVMISAKERICKRGVLCRDGKNLCPASSAKDVVRAAISLYRSIAPVITEAELLRVAESYSVCPHELSLTYSELCDVIILDVNYLFDPRVYIKRYFLHGGRYSFLIDEAHNLPDRAREMYSAEISEDTLLIPHTSSEIGEYSALRSLALNETEALRALLYPYVKDEVRVDKDGVRRGFAHISEPPVELYGMFERLAETAEAELYSAIRAKDESSGAKVKLLRSYLGEVKRVLDVLDMFDGGFEMFIRLDGEKISFKLFCIDTSTPIAKRLERGRAAVFFSATLAPLSYYRSVLGGDRSSSTLEIASPFDPSQLSVTVMDKISTRQSEREDTLAAVCRAIAATVSARRGHYMIFSPSFAYSEALARAFSAKYPKIKVQVQKRDMTKSERADFLAEFKKNEGTYLVAFCVMGGIYSEGIDLAGDSLIGAVIVGIGMPALSVEREAIAAYYDEKCDEGKQYAYIYPGMNRVLQAAGRVIRREGDRGVIVLIDDRFADPIYKKGIPALWSDFEFQSDPKELKKRLDEFWNKDVKNTEKTVP